jgi:NAD+ kinase
MAGKRREIRKVLLVINSLKTDVGSVARSIDDFVRSRGGETVAVDFAGPVDPAALEGVDLAVSLGGDGTLLACARMVAERGVPILAVNMGDFGFITEVSRSELFDAWEKFLSGRIGTSERLMFSATVRRDDVEIASFTGLNDAVISTLGISRMIRLKVFLSDTAVGRYRADGVIVATPTGSTAYSMAAGGPIVYPEMEAFILTPICPFTLSNRPTVVPASEILRIEVEDPQKTDVALTVDGQESLTLAPRDCVLIRRAAKKALIVRSDKRSFYEVMRTKLNWSGEPNA